MDKKIGFIGCGNMAGAMIGGIISSKTTSAENVMTSDLSNEKLQHIKEQYGISITKNNKEVAKFADVLIFSIKPNKYSSIMKEVKDYIKENTIIVSIAPGINIETIENYFGENTKVIRTMPNTSAMVGEAMSSLSYNKFVNDEDLNIVYEIFDSFGKVEIIDEKLMDIVTSAAGSSPALVYMFIEALADGVVFEGLPRDKAYKMTAQAVLGAAKMVLETGKHPGELKDNVCSPGGTTIEAVYALEKHGFRGHVMGAMKRCTEKSKRMGKNE